MKFGRNIGILLTTILALLFLANCSSRSISNILNTECELPCWHGITPGQTSESETLKLLEQIEGYSSTRVEKKAETSKIFAYFENDIQFLGFVENNVIVDIKIGKGNYWRPTIWSPSIRLKNIIRFAGEPEKFFIGSISSGDIFTLDAFLIYPDLSMIVVTEVKGTSPGNYTPFKIFDREKVSDIYLVSPNDLENKIVELHDNYHLFNENRMYDWNGLVEYE